MNNIIVLEGNDGGGKTTIHNMLKDRKFIENADFFRDPGSTFGAEEIRSLIFKSGELMFSPDTIHYLYCAARAELIDKCIISSLKQGKPVILDRWFKTTQVFQSEHGVDIKTIELNIKDNVYKIEETINAKLNICNIILLCDPEVALKRKKGVKEDYWEKKGLEFSKRIYYKYMELQGDNDKLIDTTNLTIEEVYDIVCNTIIEKLDVRKNFINQSVNI